MHPGSTRGRPSWRPRWAEQSWQEGRALPVGITWDRNGRQVGPFYPTSSIAGPVEQRTSHVGEAVATLSSARGTRDATRHAAGHAAPSDPGRRLTPAQRADRCPVCRDFLGLVCRDKSRPIAITMSSLTHPGQLPADAVLRHEGGERRPSDAAPNCQWQTKAARSKTYAT